MVIRHKNPRFFLFLSVMEHTMHDLTTDGLQAFMNRFKFDSSKTGRVGVERECFVTNKSGIIVPEAPRLLHLLEKLDNERRFGYELSACQVEGHTGPSHIDDLQENLAIGDKLLARALNALDLSVSYQEVAPADMPLDVFPDPTGRYQVITSNMPRNILLAACRVIGTHVHVGMPNHDTALKVYDRVAPHCEDLIKLGDNSGGHRLEIYREVKQDCEPGPYATWPDFHREAMREGFDVDLRKCWTLIRISKFGTIEARMFGATASLERVTHWARTFHSLCMDAMT